MYKLLIVDDEYEIRHGLANYFPWNDVGFEVVSTASNGQEALDYILENPVDVLLTDIKMPVMSGIELAAELSLREKEIITLFLSGYKDFDYAQQAITYKVRHYIVKPTKYTQIMEVFNLIRVELDKRSSPSTQSDQNIDSSIPEGQTIAFIKSYVKQNYATVTLEDVANNLYMNPYYISKLFKDRTGVNFSDYVMKVKMKKAVELMKDAGYKIYEISELVGYSNAKNFSRAFKKYYNQSPSEYRSSLIYDIKFK